MQSRFDPTRKTAGQIYLDNYRKTHDTDDPILLGRSISEKYPEGIMECLETHKSIWPSQDFFVKAILRRNPLIPTEFKAQYMANLACPTPDYDQIVYKYSNKKDDIKEIWVIPSKWGCLWMIQNAQYLPKDWHQLLGFIYMFANGTLYKWALKENKERGIGDSRIVY